MLRSGKLKRILFVFSFSLVGAVLNASEKPKYQTLFDVRKTIDDSKIGIGEFSGRTYSYSWFNGFGESYCSAFAFENPISGRIQAMTAYHCISNPDSFNDTARDSNSVLLVQNPFSDSMPLGTNNEYQHSKIQDTFSSIIPEPEKLNPEHIVRAADAMPEPGSLISIEGYRYVGLLGLKLATVTNSPRNVACIYMGKNIWENSISYFNKGLDARFTLGHYAYCPKNLVKEGMSGGLISNERGEALGVVSSLLAADLTANMDYDVVYFPGITKNDYLYSVPNSLVPMKNYENKEFYNLSSIWVKDETSSEDTSQKGSTKFRMGAHTKYSYRLSMKDNFIDGVSVQEDDKNNVVGFDWYDLGVICRTNNFGFEMPAGERRKVFGRMIGYQKRDRPDACKKYGL